MSEKTNGKTQQVTSLAVPPKVKQVRGLLEQMKSQIATALPRHLDAGRFIRVALTTYQQSRQLQECSDISFLASLMQAAQLGLEPDGLLGQAYIIPYDKHAQLIIGYKGLLRLARNSGEIRNFQAEAVYLNDVFKYRYGIGATLVHEPSEDADRGPITHAWAMAEFKDGGYQFKVLPKEKIEKIRNQSPAARADEQRITEYLNNHKNASREQAIEFLTANRKLSPWFTSEEEMYVKTAIRALCKRLTLQPEVHKALAREDAIEAGLQVPVDASSLAPEVVLDVTPEIETEAQPSTPEGETKSDRLANKLAGTQPPLEPETC